LEVEQLREEAWLKEQKQMEEMAQKAGEDEAHRK
jgi:hypothetical protein